MASTTLSSLLADDNPPRTLADATAIADRICRPSTPARSGADRYFQSASGDLLGVLLFAAAATGRPITRTVWDWLNDGEAPDREIRPLLERLADDLDQLKGVRADAIYALTRLHPGHDPRAQTTVRYTANERFRARVLGPNGGHR